MEPEKPELKEEEQQPPVEEKSEEKPEEKPAPEEPPKETKNAETSQAIIMYNPEPVHQASNPIKDAGSWLRDYMTAVKTGRFHPFTKTERKARAATRNQSYGPSGNELNELARLSHNAVDNSIIFGVIEFRLGYPPTKWRNVYKALTVLEFLIKKGSEDAVARAKSSMPGRLDLLSQFAYIAPDGRDVGDNVRHRALAINTLLKDDEKLKAERILAAKKQMGNNADTTAPSQEDNNAADGAASKSSTIPPVESTKNITVEDNRKRVAALKRLLARPENKLCADCSNPGVGNKPTWASVTCGVFLCLRCAGAHRSLGTHISQVRSISLDTWSSSQVAFLAGCGGNAAANEYWEALLPEGGKPASNSGADLEAFVRRKYADKAYILPDGVWPPEEPFEDDEIAEILDSILSDEEREARLAAAEAEATEAANTDLLNNDEQQPAEDGVEEEAVDITEEDQNKEGEEAVEEPKEEEAPPPPPPAPIPDLINLMDFDMEEPTPQDTTTDGAVTADGDNAAANGAVKQEEEDIDPLKALESMFIEPKPETDPFAVAQPPSSLNAWDMGAVLQTKQATEMAVSQEQQQVNGAHTPMQQQAMTYPPQQQPPAYLPPWAPQPHVMLPQGMTPPGDAAMTFTAGFSAVPQQFTAAPVLPPPPFALTTGASGNPFADGPGTGSNGTQTPPMMPWQQQQQQHYNMQPHELKAQNVMLGGLDSFVSHAGLITVKEQQSPLGPVMPHTGSMRGMREGGSPGTSPGGMAQMNGGQQNGGVNGGTSGFQVQF